MNFTENYKFNLPQLLDAAFIVKYNENIVMIDSLLKEWKDIINVEIENITDNMIEDINQDIKDLENEIYQNKTANQMLEENVNELYKLVNNDNDYLMNHFEQRFITIESQTNILETDYINLSSNYDNTLVLVSDKSNVIDQLLIENTQFENELSTMNQEISDLETQSKLTDDKLDILKEKLRIFVNDNSNEILLTDTSFNEVLDKFLLIYREV